MSWFAIFFFLSGLCSIVYELVWLRLAMAKFGVTTALVSILLSVFMAGLGAGSWFAGRWVRRYGRRSQDPSVATLCRLRTAHRHLRPGGSAGVAMGQPPAGEDCRQRNGFVGSLLPAFRTVAGADAGSLVRLHGGHDSIGHVCHPARHPAAVAALLQLPLYR